VPYAASIPFPIVSAAPVEVRVLGELALTRGGVPQAFPASRKTRALFAYLALTARTHRRERLCEIFWDLPDDPRASLRWALSKIRPLVNDPRHERLTADRERVTLTLATGDIDLPAIRARLAEPSDDLTPAALMRMADALRLPLLDGLDLPQSEIWQSWLTAMRNDVHQTCLDVLGRLTRRLDRDPAQMLRWATVWEGEDPLSREAASHLVRALRLLGRPDEAVERGDAYRRLAAEAGIRGDLIADIADAGRDAPPAPAAAAPARHQSIGFCTTPDGVRLAYASVGSGKPLVKAANWLNHLELDWESPIWARTFQALADQRTFIRYDSRGNGMSDRDVADLSFTAFVRDLEAVADTIGLTSFPLLGMSQGAAASIAYAVRNPGRVSALILIGGYAAGWRIGATPEERERREAVMTLTRLGWGTSNAAYRHIFSQTFMPDASPEILTWFDEFQRQTTSAENAVRFQDAFGDIDVRGMLKDVRVPTLVLHARDDQRITLDQGRELAIGIPGARLVTLESRNHIILGDEPAWGVAMAEIERFLGGLGL
jgi:pimeloyl-ACP methyl ester carboxylesterase/DNA-binding SARP family transcriptional activator